MQLGLRQPQQPRWALSQQYNCAGVSFVAASAECKLHPSDRSNAES
jgi:hypothetical protein